MNNKDDKDNNKHRVPSIEIKRNIANESPKIIKKNPTAKQLQYDVIKILHNENILCMSPQKYNCKPINCYMQYFNESNEENDPNKEYYEQFLKSITVNTKNLPLSNNNTNTNERAPFKKNIKFLPLNFNEFKNVPKINLNGDRKNQSSKSIQKRKLIQFKIDETTIKNNKPTELKRHETVINTNHHSDIIQKFLNDKRKNSSQIEKSVESIPKKENKMTLKDDNPNRNDSDKKIKDLNKQIASETEINNPPIEICNKSVKKKKKSFLSFFCCIPLSTHLVNKASQRDVVTYTQKIT